MGNDYRGVDRHSGMRVVQVTYHLSFATMNHGQPGFLTPGGLLKVVVLPAPVGSTPRVLSSPTSLAPESRTRLQVPMPLVLGLATNTTAGLRSISCRFTGYDSLDNPLVETISITDAPAAVSALFMNVTQAFGTKIFARLTKSELLSAVNCAPAVVGTPSELGDTIKVGTSFYYHPRFGFPAPVGRVEDVLTATLLFSRSVALVNSVNLLEGAGAGHEQYARIDIPGQYLEFQNTTTPPIDFLGLLYLLASEGEAFTLNMRVRTSIGFSSGAPAYRTSDVFIPSAGE